MSETNQNIRSVAGNNDVSDGNLQTLNNQRSVVVEEEDDDDIQKSQPVAETAEGMINEVDSTVTRVLHVAENAISSNRNVTDDNTTTTTNSGNHIVDTDSILTITNVEACVSPPTSRNNYQQQSTTNKHIMISYNRATATTICQKIHDRLTERHYEVWFDRKNLTTGSILGAMGEAIDNAYVILLCLNEGYSKSDYAPDEAKYARERKIPLIPCMVQKEYQPRGGLGFIKSDLKHVEFFDDDKFDESFEDLVRQIDAIAERSVPVDNINFRDHFNAILNEHMLSIQNCYLPQRNLNETEFWTFLHRLIQEFSPQTWESFQNNQFNVAADEQVQEGDNNRLIQYLFVNNERLESLLHIQQENYTRLEQYIIDQDDRLAAFQRFQQRQEQEHPRPNSNELVTSLFDIREMQRRGEERNDRTIRRLEQHIELLTEFVVNEQEQRTREIQTIHRLVDRPLEISSNTQQQQASYFNFDLLKNVIQTTVLLCTLVVLFKNR